MSKSKKHVLVLLEKGLSITAEDIKQTLEKNFDLSVHTAHDIFVAENFVNQMEESIDLIIMEHIFPNNKFLPRKGPVIIIFDLESEAEKFIEEYPFELDFFMSTLVKPIDMQELIGDVRQSLQIN